MPSNLDVVKAWVEACNQGDLEGALSICSPSFELIESRTLPGAVRATGLERVRRYLERFDTHWSEMEWLPQEFVEAGEKVMMVARLKLRGRKSGIEVDRTWVYVFTVRNGQLVSQEGFDDRAEGLRAAGVK